MCRAVDQLIPNVCCCCLQQQMDSNDQFLHMKHEVFVYNNKTVAFFEGYVDVNNNSLEDSANFTSSEASICKDCAVQMESAYVFRKMCQEATKILQRKSVTNTPAAEQSGQGLKNDTPTVATQSNLCHVSIDRVQKKKRKKADSRIQTAIQQSPVRETRSAQRNLRSSNKNALAIITESKDHNATLDKKESHTLQRVQVSSVLKFICKKCPKTFKSKIGLSSHRSIKHRDVIFTRDLYVRVSKRKSTLRVLDRTKQNYCEKCEKAFESQQSHYQHERSVHKIRFRCKKCPSVYLSEFRLKRHTHLKHSNTRIICKTCKKSFMNYHNLYTHKKKIHKMMHVCNKCENSFENQTSLENHVQNKHKKTHACVDCDKDFNSASRRFLHSQRVHVKPQYKCMKCAKVYSRPDVLWRHIYNKHENKRYSCQDCDKTYHSSNSLSRHQKSIHKKLQFRCKKCPKAFQKYYSLDNHIHSDHLNTSYVCEDCKKVCKTPTSLFKHKVMHENKQYHCQNCDKVFRSFNGLNYHKTTHLKNLLK
jgi:hypothetical protein